MTVDREIIDSLVDQLNSGVEYPAMELSGWKKVSGKGTKFLSISPKKPYVKDAGYTSKGKAGSSQAMHLMMIFHSDHAETEA
jgi:hypothetical protein